MKISDLFQTKEDEFLHRLIIEEAFHTGFAPGEWKKRVRDIVRASTDQEEFIDRFLADERFHNEPEALFLLKKKRTGDVWLRIRENFGDECFKTVSDAGGVKVGNDQLSLVIPNGYGDGYTRCAVLEESEFFVSPLMDFFTILKGTFNIYYYDCGEDDENDIVTTVSGRFSVYTHEGLVAFVRLR